MYLVDGNTWSARFVEECMGIVYFMGALVDIPFVTILESESGFWVECLVRHTIYDIDVERMYYLYERGKRGVLTIERRDGTRHDIFDTLMHPMFARDIVWRIDQNAKFRTATLRDLARLPLSFWKTDSIYVHESELLNRFHMASIWRNVLAQTRFESTAFETEECTLVIERDTLTIDNGLAQMDIHLSNGLSPVELHSLFVHMARHVVRQEAWRALVKRAAMGHLGRRMELLAHVD